MTLPAAPLRLACILPRRHFPFVPQTNSDKVMLNDDALNDYETNLLRDNGMSEAAIEKIVNLTKEEGWEEDDDIHDELRSLLHAEGFTYEESDWHNPEDDYHAWKFEIFKGGSFLVYLGCMTNQ